jgi:3-hydroxyisobutyrate dehydrogenase-like beta-hydroxyacid dehydrogenase
MAKHKLGFIGVGNMGGPMGGHLLKAGHELVVYDNNPAAAAKTEGSGQTSGRPSLAA